MAVDDKGPKGRGQQAPSGSQGASQAPASETLDPTAKRRVTCSLPNAGKQIDGLAFARVKLGGTTVHISEHIADDKQYKRLVTVPGFDAWSGDEAEHARTIEDALEASRKAPSNLASSALADYERRLREQQTANRSMAAQMKQLSDDLAVEKTKSAELQLQVEALKNARAQVEAPAAAKVATV